MTEGSRQTVTQHDRFANPKDVAKSLPLPRQAGNVVRMDYFLILEAALEHASLSAVAMRFLRFLCDRAKPTGFAWGRIEDFAVLFDLDRRNLFSHRKELERAGLLRVKTVHRGQKLPSGERANHQTTVFIPCNPLFTKGSRIDSILDPKDPGCASETLLCDLILERERERDTPFSEQEPKTETQTEAGCVRDIAMTILLRWHARLDHENRLRNAPEATKRRWTELIALRLSEGATQAACFEAIEAHVASPLNKPMHRRSPEHVFENRERLRFMIGLRRKQLTEGEGPPSQTRLVTGTLMEAAREINAESVAIAKEEGLDNVHNEWRKFTNEHASRGRRLVDWLAAWRKWCITANEYQKRNRKDDDRPYFAPFKFKEDT